MTCPRVPIGIKIEEILVRKLIMSASIYKLNTTTFMVHERDEKKKKTATYCFQFYYVIYFGMISEGFNQKVKKERKENPHK